MRCAQAAEARDAAPEGDRDRGDLCPAGPTTLDRVRGLANDVRIVVLTVACELELTPLPGSATWVRLQPTGPSPWRPWRRSTDP